MANPNPTISTLLFFFLLLVFIVNSSATNKDCGIAVYWGSNYSEDSLKYACTIPYYNTIIIAYLTNFGHGLVPNLTIDHPTPQIHDIQYCLDRGKKLLLSLGGATGEYGFSSAAEAKGMADYLWNSFLSGNATNSSRPFGTIPIDGIDLAIVKGSSLHYEVLVGELAKYNKTSPRRIYLSAAPQCHYPDPYLDAAIDTEVLDYVWPRFYNNSVCDMSAGDPDVFEKHWNNWLNPMAEFNYTKLLVGVPASPAAGTGYIVPDVFDYEIMPRIRYSSTYGGTMVWNRYYDTIPANYTAAIYRPACDYSANAMILAQVI